MDLAAVSAASRSRSVLDNSARCAPRACALEYDLTEGYVAGTTFVDRRASSSSLLVRSQPLSSMVDWRICVTCRYGGLFDYAKFSL
jgi:hypothetical protein